MELAMDLGLGAFVLLVIGSLVIGVVAQAIGTPGTGYEWVVTSIGALLGGLVASEVIVALQDVGPVWDGLALVPALVGALLVGGIAAAVTRFATGGTYAGHPMGA